MRRISAIVLLASLLMPVGAVLAQDAPTPIVTMPNRRYNQGTETLGPVSVPQGATSVTVTATRVSWPTNGGLPVIEIMLDVSFDGGHTWLAWGGFTALGGDAIKRDGSIATSSTGTLDLPESVSTMRQVRGTVKINKALDSAISVEVK